MAVTIVRSLWQDDDGTGTTGTVINQALHTALYNEIDGALAKVAQLAGGNSFTGAQAITGNITVVASNVSISNSVGASVQLNVRNPVAGTGNNAELSLGIDTQARQLILQAFASNFASQGNTYVADGVTATVQGTGGLSVQCTAAAPIRFFTAAAERMRIDPNGYVLVNTITNPILSQVMIGANGAVNVGICIQNTNAVTALGMIYFLNSGNGAIGNITQSGATVIYNTSSDQRLKEDAGRATDLSSLRAVVVHDFTWKIDGVRARGVFAQEAASLFPNAITAGTDDLTESGDLKQPWMTDYSKFVPDLIVGFQQHDTRMISFEEYHAALAGLIATAQTEIAELRAALAAAKG